MTSPNVFTSAEWELLGDTPLAACAAVSLAEPGGAESEVAAVLTGWRDAAQIFARSELLQTIIAELDPEQREASGQPAASRRPPSRASIRAEALELCERAADLLAQTVTAQESTDYKRFVMFMAVRVANAESEGGFLGVGGAAVSPAERAMLQDIALALGYTA